MRIKLNGWQRIGVVLSVIWFIGFAAYTAYIWNDEEHKYWSADQADIFSEATNECLRRSEVDYWLDSAKWHATYDKCLYEAHARYIAKMFALNFGVIVFGWLAAWLGIVVTRWIRRGFA
jgi:hypothetical protein